MTREIKFRVWDTTRKIMLYPEDLTHDWYFRCDTFQVHQVKEKFGQLCINEIKDPVIMQYTGLKDKSGKGVYEGDIVLDTTNFVGKSLDDIREPIRFEIVIGRALSILYRTLDGEWLDAGNDYERRLEVIGNIYENPELVDNGVLE